MPDGKMDTKLAVIQNDLGYIKEQIKGIDNKVSTHLVTREEFEPVKKIVYGLVGLALIAVVTAVLNMVVQR